MQAEKKVRERKAAKKDTEFNDLIAFQTFPKFKLQGHISSTSSLHFFVCQIFSALLRKKKSHLAKRIFWYCLK